MGTLELAEMNGNDIFHLEAFPLGAVGKGWYHFLAAILRDACPLGLLFSRFPGGCCPFGHHGPLGVVRIRKQLSPPVSLFS